MTTKTQTQQCEEVILSNVKALCARVEQLEGRVKFLNNELGAAQKAAKPDEAMYDRCKMYEECLTEVLRLCSLPNVNEAVLIARIEEEVVQVTSNSSED